MLLCTRKHALLAALVLAFAAVVAAMPAPGVTVTVFTAGDDGYVFYRIPSLITTQKGTLLAFAEAKPDNDGDVDSKAIALKRSLDNGTTWSRMIIVYRNYSDSNHSTEYTGSFSPVQIRATGRILVPFVRSNREVFQTHSDDDGVTWSAPEPCPNATRPEWDWVTTGPPTSVQLRSGRLVAGAHHFIKAYSKGAACHLIVNDDPNGAAHAWRVTATAEGPVPTDECTAIELEPNHLLVSVRGYGSRRMQMDSYDGGNTLTPPYYVDLTEPPGGCEGSVLYHPSDDVVLFTGTMNTTHRTNLSLFKSYNHGGTWEYVQTVNQYRTAYSSLTMMPDRKHVGVFFEWTNSTVTYNPSWMSFQIVYPMD